MARGDYRNDIKSFVDDIESNVNDILSIAEKIDTDDVEAMKSGIGNIINELQELAYKLY